MGFDERIGPDHSIHEQLNVDRFCWPSKLRAPARELFQTDLSGFVEVQKIEEVSRF
jgi:hypothetical protein